MLQLVEKFDINKVLPLLIGDTYSVFAKAVLSGRASGRVYLDNALNPKICAIVCDEEERCYFSLRSAYGNEAFWKETILETILHDQYKKNGMELEIFCHPEADSSVSELFLSLDATWESAFLYRLDNINVPELPIAVPDAFTLKKVNDDFIKKARVANKKLITQEWNKRTDNVEGIRGFCLLYDKKVVSVCHIDFRYENTIEIGIITDKQFRRKGLAVATVANSINYFFRNGIEHIIWHAPQDNKGSCRVAEKCDMKIERIFGEFVMHYEEGYRLLMKGYRYVRDGKLSMGADIYRKALKVVKDSKKPFVGFHNKQEVLAWILQCYCETKNKTELFATIKEMDDYGLCLSKYFIKSIESHSKFEFLYKSPEWQAIKTI